MPGFIYNFTVLFELEKAKKNFFKDITQIEKQQNGVVKDLRLLKNCRCKQKK